MSLIDFFIAHLDDLRSQIIEHLLLTLVSIFSAAVVGISTGIFISRVPSFSKFTLGFVGIIQTIPSLALLGFLLPVFGIGAVPAIIALFLYALLPIVRNTYTGITEVKPSIIEASRGMGMSDLQILRYVELPLAFPVILAGIRTSAVINVGIATLCALIAAGGLGEFIFRGISLNNVNMILAGAIPASILAITFDAVLGLLERNFANKKLWLATGLAFTLIVFLVRPSQSAEAHFIAGFNHEFIEREDGFDGLNKIYELPMEIKEMEIGLMYQAIKEQEVDVIHGFSTDGRIKGYNLVSLIDDKNYFPPYYTAPLINGETLQKFPELQACFALLSNTITDEKMTQLNYLVDGLKRPMNEVANEFLKELNIYANPNAGNSASPDLLIGSKAFTENYLLAHIFAQLIENKTKLKTQLKLGFGGTKLVFDALRLGEIDIYPEYSGTGYLVLLQHKKGESKNFTNPSFIYETVKTEFKEKYNIHWMPILGFNNTSALVMRAKHADSLQISTISDLSNYLKSKRK